MTGMAAASKKVDRDLQELQDNIDDLVAQVCEKYKNGEGVWRGSSENVSHWKTEQDSGKKEIAQLALDLFSLLIDAQLAVTFVIK